MTAKPKKPGKALIDPVKESFDAMNRARFAFSPSMNASVLAQDFSFHQRLDLTDLSELMAQECKDVHGGDLRRVESMLISQAHSLDVIFASLAHRGKIQEGLKQYEAHMRLALKAQSQCRATLETLATIKNPPAVFAKQANISHGPQQVNNDSASIARAEEIDKPQTKLLEHDHEQWLDSGTKTATSRSNPPMETVAAVDRSTKRRREGQGQP